MVYALSKMKEQETTQPAGDIRINEPMSKYTTWRVGGPADRFYIPKDRDELSRFMKSFYNDQPLLWIGLGSNILVRDGGIRGTVVYTSRGLRGLKRNKSNDLQVDSGVPCAHVARISAELGLTGGEFFAGIPGTIGGALAMNAGAFGGETWKFVNSVTTINKQGEVYTRYPSDYEIGYRSVVGPNDEWFISADLRFKEGDVRQSQARIKQLLSQRGQTQPTNIPNCGSVFRNPPGDYAAHLIEASGLKGLRIGGACVSEKHANFILNTGDARAKDIESLINKVRDEVERQQGVQLKLEVRIIGESENNRK